MKSAIKLTAFVLFFLQVIKAEAGNGQDELKAGWDNLAINNFSQVQSHFENALKDTAISGDACLSLAIYYSGIYQNNKSVEMLKKYISQSKDPNPGIFAMDDSPFIQDMAVKDKIIYYENIINTPSVNETNKAIAYDRLTPLYEETNDMNKLKTARNNVGAIIDWQLLGVFENLSGSGFNKDFGAVAHPEKGYLFTSKNGNEMSWFELQKDRIRNDRWIDFTFYFIKANTVIYAQTFVTAQNDMECQLRLGTSGSYKVWINDHIIMSDAEERNNDVDTYISNVKLYKGVNRILIQIGCSEVTNSNFLCRITDNKGKPVSGLTFSSVYTAYNTNYDFKSSTVPIFAEEYYRSKIEQKPDLLNMLLLARCYLRNDKTYDAALVLRDAEKLSPDCGYMLALKAEQATQAKNYSGLSAILTRMKTVMPDSYDALELQYEEYKDGENYDQAEEVVNKMIKKFGEDPSLLGKQISLLASTKQIEKMLSSIDYAYKKYPDYYTFVELQFMVENKMKKNSSEAVRILKIYISKHQLINAMSDLKDKYLEDNMTNDAIALLEKMVEIHPYAVGFYNQLAEIYYSLGNYRKAHEYNDLCYKIAPYISDYDELKGDIYAAEKKTNDSRDAYERSIVLAPTNYDSRMKLRKLENKPDVFDVFNKIDFQNLYKSAPSAQDFPESNSDIILDETHKVVFKGGASMEKTYVMVKVFNASGIDEWKEYNISVYDGQRLVVDEAYVIKKNNSKIDAERNDNQIVFNNLEIGDAVCLSYKIENYYTGKLAKYFYDEHYFSYFLPVKHISYQLMIDSTISFKYDMKHEQSTPTIKNIDDFKFYNWQADNIPAIKYENGMPNLADVAPILRISTFKNWDEVSKWYNEISSSKAKPDYEVKEVMRELFDGTKLTDEQKASKIYDYITREIRYSSNKFRQNGLIPQTTGSVLNSRIGDCKDVSTLFVTMCREAGLQANLTLISTNSNGYEKLFLPGIDFDHCISAVMINGKKRFIELTNDCNPFNTINTELINAQALEIREDSVNNLFHISSNYYKPNIIERKTTVNINGDTLKVQKNTMKTGEEASNIRRTYRDIGKEQQEKTLKESLTDEYPGIHLTDFKFDDNLHSTSDSVTYLFSYQTNEAISDVAGMRVFRLPFSESIQKLQILSEENRKYPIVTSTSLFCSSSSETITLTLPAGQVLMVVPQSVNYKTEFGEYSLTFKPSGFL